MAETTEATGGHAPEAIGGHAPEAIGGHAPEAIGGHAPVERYNPYTGRRVVAGVDDAVPTAAQLGLEPPRFCEACGRRMVVQISPDGWWAKCSRHGVFDSICSARR